MASAELTAILVHYRTPVRLQRAIRELRGHLRPLGLDHRIVVVDNSGDAGCVEGATVISGPGNLGYAGAANLGFRNAPARHYLLLNPDVSLLDGAVEGLLGACAPDQAAGPSFYWDRERRFLLPPTWQPVGGAGQRLLARLSPRGAAARLRRSWRLHARAHWQATGPLRSRYLSGAVLLLGAEALRQVGPLDESYRLYFEETDWLRRAEKQGVETFFVPTAEAVHDWNASGALEPAAEDWYSSSERLYRRRYRLGPSPPLKAPGDLPEWSGHLPAPREDQWLELSPSPAGVPAAAERLAAPAAPTRRTDEPRSWRPPAEIEQRIGGWQLCIADGRGNELVRYRLPHPEGAPA